MRRHRQQVALTRGHVYWRGFKRVVGSDDVKAVLERRLKLWYEIRLSGKDYRVHILWLGIEGCLSES
jgi:hypothetical protein